MTKSLHVRLMFISSLTASCWISKETTKALRTLTTRPSAGRGMPQTSEKSGWPGWIASCPRLVPLWPTKSNQSSLDSLTNHWAACRWSSSYHWVRSEERLTTRTTCITPLSSFASNEWRRSNLWRASMIGLFPWCLGILNWLWSEWYEWWLLLLDPYLAWNIKNYWLITWYNKIITWYKDIITVCNYL